MKPYYENENGKLYHGDCLEIMPMLDKVDLVLTSPPYDNLRNYNGYSFRFKETAIEIKNKLLHGGLIVWIVGDATISGSETGTSFRQALYFKDVCGLNIHDTMIYKSHKPPLTHNRYEQAFEYMFIFSNGKPKTFNPILKRNKFSGQNALRNGNWASGKDKSAIRQRQGFKKIKDFSYKNNIWEYKTGGGQSATDKIAFNHPAIFPESLAGDHILSWSDAGNVILDPFFGSGTTGKMAEIYNRKWIGIEISEKYCEIAAKRIEAENRQLKLF